jgi:GTP-binding protein
MFYPRLFSFSKRNFVVKKGNFVVHPFSSHAFGYPKFSCNFAPSKCKQKMRKIRNIAIIAHVDHGKTTLVDKMILMGNLFRNAEQAGELILDNNDLERERGITILAKNVSVTYKGYKINIIDTPGHADFGGEVERVLNMADGVLLLVDAFEGTMPQTRFVLQKALSLGLKPIVVINKVDKQNCRPEEVNEEVFDLMINLGASERQLDFKTVYGSAKQGWMSVDWKKASNDISPLLDLIIEEIPEPKFIDDTPQLLITSLEYSNYLGRIAVGRVARGRLTNGMNISLVKRDGVTIVRSKIKDLMTFEGMEKKKVETVDCGDICAIVGVEGFEIGDTIADYENPEGLDPISVDEPTMSMLFMINDSPFFGRDGKYVTSRHIKERLDRELEKNLALRVEQGENADSFTVYGRGVLHLSILIETMRREGYELQVGQPKVIIKEINGEKYEPVEFLTIDVPEHLSGKTIEMVSRRKGAIISVENDGERIHLEFEIPSRGIIGLRSNMLTATQGEAIMSHIVKGFEPYKGAIEMRTNGSLIALETGMAIAYSIDKLQDRGKFFIIPGDEIYSGQVIGEHTRADDLTINVCKTKKLTNIRASGSDEKARIEPPVIFSLEEALEYIKADECVEVTPNAIRMRKLLLDENARKRAKN